MSIPPSVERLPIGNKSSQSARGTPRPNSEAGNKADDHVEVGVGGTMLDFGRPGGAGLVRGGRGWKWAWAKREDQGLILEHGKTELLVPPTRSLDASLPAHTPLSTITRSANQVIRSAVDKYAHLGLDELILPDLEQIHEELQKPQPDHFQGNVMEVIQNPRAKYVRTMLAFAVGEVGQDLNISPFLPKSFASSSRLNLTDFAPSAEPVESFPTSILQICGSGAQQAWRQDWGATCLIVRLHSSVHWLHVFPNQGFSTFGDEPCASTTQLGCIRTVDTEGRRIMDVAMDPIAWGRAVLMDEGGGVWTWVEERVEVRERLEKVLRLTKIRPAVSETNKGFWRISYGLKDDTIIVLGEREAVMIDLQDTERPPTSILTLTGEGRFFTSLDKSVASRKPGYFAFCTTHEVIWVDELRPGVPALVWKHHYGGGKLRDLDISTIVENTQGRILLSSRSHPLVMVYTISDSPPFESQCRPYLIPLPSGLQGIISSASLELLRSNRPSSTLWMVMGEDGSIYGIPLYSPSDEADGAKEERTRIVRIESSWNRSTAEFTSGTLAALEEIAGEAAVPGEEEEDPGARRSKVMNARWAWLEINQSEAAGEEAVLYPDEFERYLREFDVPVDHWMSGAELARDALVIEEGEHISRYAPIAVDTTDEDAWGEIRFDNHLQQIANFRSNSAENDTFRNALEELERSFPVPPTLTPRLRAAHREHLYRLALDLAWSGIILSTDPPTLTSAPARTPAESATATAAEEFLSRAANLTLNEREPPALAFSVLPPRAPLTQFDSGPTSRTASPGEEREPADGAEVLQAALGSIPARSLISEWTLGTPAEYLWKPWRTSDSAGIPLLPTARPIKPLPSPRHAQAPTFASQQIPGIYSSTQPPATTTFRQPPALGGFASMNAFIAPPRARSSSPALGGPDEGAEMPMTQIERGPFGGRTVEKKKKFKKRAGGF